MNDEKRRIRNARYYENNRERLQKLNRNEYYANKEILQKGKDNVIMLKNRLRFKFNLFNSLF